MFWTRHQCSVVTNGEYAALDEYQWAITAAAHDERHVAQMIE